MVAAQCIIILITLYFQFGTRNYKIIALTAFGGGVLFLAFTAIFVPESPQWQEERGEQEDY